MALEPKYIYRLKKHIEKELMQKCGEWYDRNEIWPNASDEDRKIIRWIFVHLIPGIDPSCLLEAAQKISDPEIRKSVIEHIEWECKNSCFLPPHEWYEDGDVMQKYVKKSVRETNL